MKELPTTGRFRCPGCSQSYDVPPATVPAIRTHLKKHKLFKDSRWIRRRLTQRGPGADRVTVDEEI